MSIGRKGGRGGKSDGGEERSRDAGFEICGRNRRGRLQRPLLVLFAEGAAWLTVLVSKARFFSGDGDRPSVRRALPPVGWQRTVEHEPQRTTVWAWEKTVVMLKQPDELEL